VDFDGTDVELGHGSGAITLGVYRHLFKPDDRAFKPDIAPRQSWRQYSAETTSG
jgi:hypothetical protein